MGTAAEDPGGWRKKSRKLAEAEHQRISKKLKEGRIMDESDRRGWTNIDEEIEGTGERGRSKKVNEGEFTSKM
jgi:hypothetical protein